MSKPIAPLAGRRCLVLDDEFIIALDIQNVLEDAGAAVVCANDVEEAMRALEAGAFDVAVLDLNLGATASTSAAVAKEVAKRGIPFIFITGLRSGDKDLKNFPNVAVVEKPYQVDLLLQAVIGALART